MIVCDASTLILLAKADLLDTLLQEYSGAITIPQAVEAECIIPPSRTDARLIQERLREHRIAVASVQDTAVVHRLITDFHLGHGEAEAIALALENHAQMVATDDRNAIRACKLLRLRFTTAIGILIRSAEKGLLREDEARRSLERLATYGRYQREILEDARRRLGGEER
jgi:predicted nucleic acid-binding protein